MPQRRSRSRAASVSAPEARIGRIVVLLLFIAMLLMGGAGMNHPLTGAVIQSGAVVLLLLSLCAPARLGLSVQPLSGLARLALLIPLLFLLVQLAPLPGDLAMRLPGRDLARDLLAAAGVSRAWPSLSLDPAISALTALELLPGIAVFVLAARGGRPMRTALIEATLAAALLALLLGLAQKLGGASEALGSVAGVQASDSRGFFVNRNHQASFLLLAIPLAALWASTTDRLADAQPRVRLLLGWGLVALFSIGVVATLSRAGFSLVPLAWIAAFLLLNRRLLALPTTLLTMLPLALLCAFASQTAIVQTTLARFTGEPDARAQFLENSARAARGFWPAGSGLGTFVEIYPAFEPFDQLSHAYVNNAHNDYAELWMEGGLPALLAFAAALALIALGFVRRFSAGVPHEDKAAATAAFTGVLILLLHSIVDYPLRMMALMAVAGLLLAMLLAGGNAAGRHGKRLPLAGGIMALALLWPIWQFALADQAVRGKAYERALAHHPWSVEALAKAGYQALGARDNARALAYGRRAMAAAPLDARGAALLIDARQATGDAAGADRLLTLAARLGWREAHIQFALTERTAQADEDYALVAHVDALLRTGSYVDIMKPYLLELETYPQSHAALIVALARRPAWRRPFLTDLSRLPPEQAEMHLGVLRGLARTGAPPAPEEVAALTRYHIARGDYGAALAVDRAFAPAGNAGLPGPLAQDNRSASPFAWRPSATIGVLTGMDETGAITIGSTGAAVGPAMTRLLVAPAGPLTLAGTVREGSTGSWRAFTWSLRCLPSNALIVPDREARQSADVPAGRDGGIAFRRHFMVPAQGCAAQTLVLGLDAPGAVDIRLTRLATQPPL